jgi:DNA-binding protein HU-beta
MNKAQLIGAVAEETGFTRADAGRAVEATLAAIEQSLRTGDDVALTGFGRFSVAERPARRGVNPATGERIRIKASRAPKFTSGARLREAVAKKPRARRRSGG